MDAAGRPIAPSESDTASRSDSDGEADGRSVARSRQLEALDHRLIPLHSGLPIDSRNRAREYGAEEVTDEGRDTQVVDGGHMP